MFAIEIQTTFSAAHALRLPTGGVEATHGHNFQVTVQLTCKNLDVMETVIDFHEVERLLDGIISPWKNQNLNEIEPFRTRINPSAERIVEQIGQQMQSAINVMPDANARGLRLAQVRLTEAANCLAIWQPS